MITIKSISIRNFLSVGNVCQSIDFNNNDLTLILGENLDLGGQDNRNGCGKSTIIQAISYALFGSPINSIRKDNLINRTNGKGMLVSIEFDANGKSYKIERGRKPNILKFYVDSNLQKKEGEEESDSQGENKQTQAEIEQVLHMSHDMFKHIVALNTYTEPFLSMKVSDQRMVIEQLLGITLLSEKAEKIKELSKEVKEQLQLEEFRIKAIEEANKKVHEQIDSLTRRQRLWTTKHNEDIAALTTSYESLNAIDIEKEIQAHNELVVCLELIERHNTYNSIKTRFTEWQAKTQKEILSLEQSLEELNSIDVTSELEAHKLLKEYIDKVDLISSLKTDQRHSESVLLKEQNVIAKLEDEISKLKDNKCYACGQVVHNHDTMLVDKQTALDSAFVNLAQTQNTLEKIKFQVSSLESGLGDKPTTIFDHEHEVIAVVSEINKTKERLVMKQSETNPFAEEFSRIVEPNPCCVELPKTHYKTIQEAYEHKSRIDSVVVQLEKKLAETDPYAEQLEDMKENALQEISFDVINELSKKQDHLKFLVDLLTNKDSFVRKKIIDQNLSYLNTRLTHYLEKIGLPHQVIFKNDLSVEITELGRELDFGNLSRGETNRLILGLSWAFRDVWESLYTPINVMFIDELLDNGTDAAGVENSLSVLKDMNRSRNKSIWLISHKDDLVSRVNSVLKVVKENGFTSFASTTENI